MRGCYFFFPKPRKVPMMKCPSCSTANHVASSRCTSCAHAFPKGIRRLDMLDHNQMPEHQQQHLAAVSPNSKVNFRFFFVSFGRGPIYFCIVYSPSFLLVGLGRSLGLRRTIYQNLQGQPFVLLCVHVLAPLGWQFGVHVPVG